MQNMIPSQILWIVTLPETNIFFPLTNIPYPLKQKEIPIGVEPAFLGAFAVSFREGTILQNWLESPSFGGVDEDLLFNLGVFFAALYPFCFRGKKCKEFTIIQFL